MKGSEASIVGPVERTPGSASRAKARSAGSEELRLAKTGCAASSTPGSSEIASRSASSSAANEPVTIRRLVIRSWSCGWRRLSATGTRAKLVIRPLRSPGSVPRNASLTCAVFL